MPTGLRARPSPSAPSCVPCSCHSPDEGLRLVGGRLPVPELTRDVARQADRLGQLLERRQNASRADSRAQGALLCRRLALGHADDYCRETGKFLRVWGFPVGIAISACQS